MNWSATALGVDIFDVLHGGKILGNLRLQIFQSQLERVKRPVPFLRRRQAPWFIGFLALFRHKTVSSEILLFADILGAFQFRLIRGNLPFQILELDFQLLQFLPAVLQTALKPLQICLLILTLHYETYSSRQ
jgi:hypothetical protein